MVDAARTFDGQILSLDVGSPDGQARVAEVRVSSRHVIPPNSVLQVKCTMNMGKVDYVVESFGNTKLMVPRVVLSAGYDPVLCLVNLRTALSRSRRTHSLRGHFRSQSTYQGNLYIRTLRNTG
ncbi:hypothetical protein DPMN_160266 [Dreissena polymorpha]|uniref:Uncharacterized protein n=1 Tax=Dreissena polymorpha TaxID=45954 RepID=A0A9D4EPU6_DREPO|nr:hypothetical protein DPMN_160266 [Dreissena polymorpha]